MIDGAKVSFERKKGVPYRERQKGSSREDQRRRKLVSCSLLESDLINAFVKKAAGPIVGVKDVREVSSPGSGRHFR